MVRPHPQIVRAAQRGEASAWEILVRLTYKDVYNLAYRYLQNPDDAADVTQEVYMALTKSLKDFRGDSSFGTWLYRITLNCSRSRLRHDIPERARVVSGVEQMELASNLPSPEAVFEGEEMSHRLAQALTNLGEIDHEAIVLSNMEQLTAKEMGQIWGVSAGAAKVRVYRARQRLLAELGRTP